MKKLRKIKLVKVCEGLYRSEDSSLAMHVAYRPWQGKEKAWHADWNTFMCGRVSFDAPSMKKVLEHAGVSRG